MTSPVRRAVCVPPPLVCGVKLAKHVSEKERHDVSEMVCIRIQNTSRAEPAEPRTEPAKSDEAPTRQKRTCNLVRSLGTDANGPVRIGLPLRTRPFNGIHPIVLNLVRYVSNRHYRVRTDRYSVSFGSFVKSLGPDPGCR